MIRYLKELENKGNFYLPLINQDDRGKKELDDYQLPMSFIEKYQNIFKNSEVLIMIYKNFDIYKWFKENSFIFIDYEKACSLWDEFDSIKEELWVLEEYQKIGVRSKNIERYFNLIKRISFLLIELIPRNKEYYEKLNITLKEAQKDLDKIMTICYVPNKVDNIYLPDSWFITPNGYLYNPGKDGHKGCDFTFDYNQLKKNISKNKIDINKKSSIGYFKIAHDIEERRYITAGQFKVYFNYISQPAYLDTIDGIPITREKHIIDMAIGITMAHAYFLQFFEELVESTKNPQEELEKIREITKDDISDILVRCCGLHKIDSNSKNTIITSCFNYEIELAEYIENGWNIQTVTPIVINKEKGCIEESSNDFFKIKKLLKK